MADNDADTMEDDTMETTDTEVEFAKPRSSELTDKLDDIMNTPNEPLNPPARPVSLSPNNEAEAQPGAIAPQEFQREPGEQDSGGG
ncbi:MAG: hypothetical protein ABIW46_09595 [Acidimicrobiales bacterium]